MNTVLNFLFCDFIFTKFSFAQFTAPNVSLSEKDFAAAKKSFEQLISDKDLVLNIPFDNEKDWDKDLIRDQAVITTVFAKNRYNINDMCKVFNFGAEALQVKEGNYFNGDFTISVWVNVSSVSKWSRIIDFGLGQNNSNIVFSSSASLSGIPGLAIYKGEGTDLTQLRGKESDRLKEGEWYHLCATLSGDVAKIYINGKEINSVSGFYIPQKRTLTKCLIGKSNFENESNFYGYMDDLRIYSRALDNYQVQLLSDQTLVNINKPSETLSLIHK